MVWAGGVAALAGVAHDAPDQPRVGGRDAVVAIQVELGQRRDIDAISLVCGRAGATAAGSARGCLP